MIKEALIYFLTPANAIAKKYGFLYQSVALEHRFERCKKIWLPHLKNCQDVFLDSCKDLPQKKSVVILGSAHLHEIPLHLLLQNFEKITLVDVIHPLKHHWASKRHPHRISLITQDLSGALTDLSTVHSLEDLHKQLQKLSEKPLFHYDADLIVSANLLSQLALLPIEAVEKKIKRPLTLPEKDFICTSFAELHLKNLESCRGRKLVYSDREVIYKDTQGEIIYSGHYPVSFQGYAKLKEWTWLLAPLKEASKDYSIEMKVEAYQQK